MGNFHIRYPLQVNEPQAYLSSIKMTYRAAQQGFKMVETPIIFVDSDCTVEGGRLRRACQDQDDVRMEMATSELTPLAYSVNLYISPADTP